MARERSRAIAVCSSCLTGVLKIFNFLLAFVGLSLSLFSLWHLYKFLDTHNLQVHLRPFISSTEWNLPDPWFIYFLLSLGVLIFVISLIGHIATESSTQCCLSFYIFLLILLALLEGAFVAEIYLNDNWQEIVPDDPSALFEHLKEFIEANLAFCKWVGLAIVIIEIMSLLLALCSRALAQLSGSVDIIDDDDDYEYMAPQTQLRQPLLFMPHRCASCRLTANSGTVEGYPVNS